MSHNAIYRIVDANINRASEALRVLEDWVRFGKNNQDIAKKLKLIRHEINKLVLLNPNLILSRESIHDVGKNTGIESKKRNIKDIIRANCKRLEESLRVLSEYGNIVEAIHELPLENFRYEIYTIEKELIINEKLIRLQNANLYLVAGRDAPAGRFYNDNEFLSIIEKSVEGGIDIIQLREKKEKENKILELGKEIKKIINNTDVLFIINDRVDLALACNADGVHLGQDDMPVARARKIIPDGFIIGLSTHSQEQGKNFVGAYGNTPVPDYLGVGPVFPTPTKPDYKPAGLEYVRWAGKNLKEIPWFAIGGIDETNIEKVINAGAGKIAVVREIMNADDPLKKTKSLKSILEKEKALCTN